MKYPIRYSAQIDLVAKAAFIMSKFKLTVILLARPKVQIPEKLIRYLRIAGEGFFLPNYRSIRIVFIQNHGGMQSLKTRYSKDITILFCCPVQVKDLPEF